MKKNENNQKRLEYLIDEAFDNMKTELIEDTKFEKKVEFSEEHDKEIKKIFNREQRKRKIKKYNHYLKRSVAILLLAFIGIGILTFSVEANRIKFLNYIIERTDKYIKIDYNNDINKDASGNNILEENIGNVNVHLNYIPNGFSLERGEKTNSSIYMFFEKEDKYFSISCRTAEGLMHLDTENAVVRNIVINEKECILIEKNSTIRVYWKNSKLVFLVFGNIEEKEIIEIIKNIE